LSLFRSETVLPFGTNRTRELRGAGKIAGSLARKSIMGVTFFAAKSAQSFV
jgi:hypothetical protein